VKFSKCEFWLTKV
jgi:hypothetical protein